MKTTLIIELLIGAFLAGRCFESQTEDTFSKWWWNEVLKATLIFLFWMPVLILGYTQDLAKWVKRKVDFTAWYYIIFKKQLTQKQIANVGDWMCQLQSLDEQTLFVKYRIFLCKQLLKNQTEQDETTEDCD